MKTYDFLGIRVGSLTNGPGDLGIISTDEKMIEWITEQIKNILPSVQFYEGASRAHLINDYKLGEKGKNLSREFHKMKDHQYTFSVLLVQELCHQGWEPFGDIHFNYDHFDRITLRRCQES